MLNVSQEFIQPTPKDPEITVEEWFGPKISDKLVVPQKTQPLDLILNAIKAVTRKPIVQPTTSGNKIVLTSNIAASSAFHQPTLTERLNAAMNSGTKPVETLPEPVYQVPQQGKKNPLYADKYLDPDNNTKRKKMKLDTSPEVEQKAEVKNNKKNPLYEYQYQDPANNGNKRKKPKVELPTPPEDPEDRPLTPDLSEGLKKALAEYKKKKSEPVQWDSDDDDEIVNPRKGKRVSGKDLSVKKEKVLVDPRKRKTVGVLKIKKL